LRLKCVIQCFNFFVKWIVMKIKLIILIKSRIFYMIEFYDKIKIRLRFCIMLNKLFFTTCYIKRNESFWKNDEDWKFFNNIWWSLNVLMINCIIFNNGNKSFLTCIKWAMSYTHMYTNHCRVFVDFFNNHFKHVKINHKRFNFFNFRCLFNLYHKNKFWCHFLNYIINENRFDYYLMKSIQKKFY
jgi:hypothetical protein